MLRGLDALVFDLQDIGSRSYTYLSTMGKCMQACAENHVEFIVLDRPDPLGGERVEGPGVGEGGISFVAQFPVPYVYGMTAGELARMINAQHWMGPPCKLTVVPMKGLAKRAMLWADTGLPWVRSSPNIPRGDSPHCITWRRGIVGDITGPELGIGTDVPFQRMSAPYLDADRVHRLPCAARGLAGMSFHAVSGRWQRGRANVHIDGRAAGNLTALNVYMIGRCTRRAAASSSARLSGQVNADLRYDLRQRVLAADDRGGHGPGGSSTNWAGGGGLASGASASRFCSIKGVVLTRRPSVGRAASWHGATPGRRTSRPYNRRLAAIQHALRNWKMPSSTCCPESITPAAVDEQETRDAAFELSRRGSVPWPVDDRRPTPATAFRDPARICPRYSMSYESANDPPDCHQHDLALRVRRDANFVSRTLAIWA